VLVRLFLRGAVLLPIAVAITIGIVLGAGRMLPSGGVIYFSQVRQGYNAHIFDPLRSVHYALSDRQSVHSGMLPSPDGQQIAFVYNDNERRVSQIRLFDFGTTHITTIYTAPGSVINTLYSWSPSGRYLSFTHGSGLLKYDFQTGETTPLIGDNRAGFFKDSYPTWSPDEMQIAFVSSLREANTWQGYLVNADGSDLRRVTRVDVCQFYAPRWSPTENLLALNANCENVPTIFLLNADTGSLRALSDLDVPTWEPVWSPDGSRLVFISGIQNRSIYTIAADGSDQQYLANGDFASWSPDGRLILFSSATGDLYTISADGGNLRRLTFGDGNPFLLAAGWSR
jgi:Tol biopolymer transport system component